MEVVLKFARSLGLVLQLALVKLVIINLDQLVHRLTTVLPVTADVLKYVAIKGRVLQIVVAIADIQSIKMASRVQRFPLHQRLQLLPAQLQAQLSDCCLS